jgi:acetolactate synthase I/II/III large subunit
VAVRETERTSSAQAQAAPTISGAEAIARCLESQGIEVVFGLCGHTNVAMLDALSRSRLRFIGVRHEAVAAHAADGYYRVTHKPAAVLTTIGAGMVNTLNGIGDAAMDGSAMVVICGDVPTYYTGREAFQETNLHADADQWEIARPIVKRAWRIAHADVLTHDLARAINYAVTGCPGPVLVSVPMDLFSQPAAYEIPDMSARRPTGAARGRGDAAEIERAAEIFGAAERPLILAGGGAVLADADREITALAEHIGAPVVTTMSGQGAISKYHPLYGGFISAFGTPVAHNLVQTADVVLVIGSKLAEMEVSSWNPEYSLRVPPTRLVQVDIEPEMIGKSYPVAVGIQGDAAAVVADILTRLQAAEPARDWRTSERYRAFDAARAEWEAELDKAARADTRPVQPERLFREIRAAMPEDGIFLCDAGARGVVAQLFPVGGPRRLLTPSGWGTMGFAMGAALGAKVGRPAATVVAEVGDGGFGTLPSAIITAVEHAIPVVWVVRNNFCFSSISVYQRKHFDNGLFGTVFRSADGMQPHNPSFAGMAAAMGAGSRLVEDPADLAAALREALDSGRPYVIEVLSEPAPRGRASGYWDVNAILSGERFRS